MLLLFIDSSSPSSSTKRTSFKSDFKADLGFAEVLEAQRESCVLGRHVHTDGDVDDVHGVVAVRHALHTHTHTIS